MADENRKNDGVTSGSRLMGLDVGDRTIGVALSDELGWTAQPYTTLRRKQLSLDLDRLRHIAEEGRVSSVVVGMPLSMSGVPGSRARRVKNFASGLEKTLGIPIVFWDERLSTVAAQRVLLQAGLSREKRKNQVDKVAAAIILQGYLDSVQR
jgi:putative Holliday junction resolvase